MAQSEYDLTPFNDPATFSQATESANSTEWFNAMKEEINSMRQNKVWDLVDRPKCFKPVGSKWVLKTKRDPNGNIERYKARLVAKGFTQRKALAIRKPFLQCLQKTLLEPLWHW